MKSNSKKNVMAHKINKNNFDIVCANNKTHHINNGNSQQKKSTTKKDIFSLNNSYDNFFTKLIN